MNELSAAEGSAWAVAVASLSVAKIPAGRLSSMSEQTTALSKSGDWLAVVELSGRGAYT